ncbi:MAG: GNAT family N-acetyltransferase [Anaerolineae bacterium]|nr:GNAT family N-acetyltransferase [Anaerolineae bacterium]MDW8298850.1 GNAT family N-acetyltransferase [Anaerolineae bacterium]
MVTVRLATLQDTAAICAVHRSDVPAWTRLTADGQVVSAEYDSLSLYERWQHGGAWMSLETCAVHLNRLLAGSGFPLVACVNGQVVAEAEVYESFEPPPFGHNLEIGVIVTHADHRRRGYGTALVQYILQMARMMRCERLCVSDADAQGFYQKLGFRHTLSGYGVRIPTEAGRIVYQAVELKQRDADQVKGWHMPFGRYRGSRQEWDKLFPQHWAAGIPELLNRATVHLQMTLSGGQRLIACFSETDQTDARTGEMHLACWSERPLTPLAVAALRDWAYRQGIPALLTYVWETDAHLLPNAATQTDHSQTFYEHSLQ